MTKKEKKNQILQKLIKFKNTTFFFFKFKLTIFGLLDWEQSVGRLNQHTKGIHIHLYKYKINTIAVSNGYIRNLKIVE